MSLKDIDLPVVVAGGAGFLGQNVVEYLVEKGRTCIIVDYQEPSLPAIRQILEEQRVSFVSADLTDSASVQAITLSLPERFQLVHMATVIETTVSVCLETESTLAWHTGISMNLADNWRDKLASLCFISSFEVYGNPEVLPFVESDPKSPIKVYGVGKLMAENYLRIFCADLVIPLNILRLTHLYGPGQTHNTAIPNFIKNCLTNLPHRLLGGGKDLREPVHVRDVAHAIWLSLNHEKNGIYNIAGGKSVNIRYLLDTIQRLTKTDLPVEDLPADRPPLDVRFDLSHAEQGLGFIPQISLEDGLRDEIEWLESLTNTSETSK